MDNEQIGLVMEFASNVKNDICDLPMTDKSKELQSQINHLQSARAVDKITIER